MKASLSLATILLAVGISGANAQNEFAIANHAGTNPSSSIKNQRIAQLEAEIAALKAELASLKGETAGSAERFSEPVPITPEAAAIVESSDLTYTVQPGDNLYKIARKTKSRASAIAAVNDMAMDVIIRPGQVLKLPASATVAAAANPPKAALVGEAPKPATQPKTYKVKEGETYYRISRNLKISLDELMAANPKIPANRLYTGRVIKLPSKDAVPAPAPAVAEPAAEEAATTAAISEAPAIQENPPAPPASQQAAVTEEAPAEAAPLGQQKIIAVSVNEEISYGDFAVKHGTTTDRLNSLNDLNLTSATILAKGSELYVPASVQTAAN